MNDKKIIELLEKLNEKIDFLLNMDNFEVDNEEGKLTNPYKPSYFS